MRCERTARAIPGAAAPKSRAGTLDHFAAAQLVVASPGYPSPRRPWLGCMEAVCAAVWPGRVPTARASTSRTSTPRGRLVALSMSTKNALAARFGPTWRAKTTEELAAEPTLAEVLGPEPLRELIEFLDRIDRLKFAAERSNYIRQPLENELADWNPRIAVLISRIEAKSNGRSQ